MIVDFFKRLIGKADREEVAPRASRVRFETTIVRFTPGPASVSETFNSSDAASAWLEACTDSDCHIGVSMWFGNFSLGDYYLWCSGDYAVARICEHRGHNATHPEGPCLVDGPVSFKDEDGSLFTASSEELLPRELAVRAMHAWLAGCERPSVLRWG